MNVISSVRFNTKKSTVVMTMLYVRFRLCWFLIARVNNEDDDHSISVFFTSSSIPFVVAVVLSGFLFLFAYIPHVVIC